MINKSVKCEWVWQKECWLVPRHQQSSWLLRSDSRLYDGKRWKHVNIETILTETVSERQGAKISYNYYIYSTLPSDTFLWYSKPTETERQKLSLWNMSDFVVPVPRSLCWFGSTSSNLQLTEVGMKLLCQLYFWSLMLWIWTYKTYWFNQMHCCVLYRLCLLKQQW